MVNYDCVECKKGSRYKQTHNLHPRCYGFCESRELPGNSRNDSIIFEIFLMWRSSQKIISIFELFSVFLEWDGCVNATASTMERFNDKMLEIDKYLIHSSISVNVNINVNVYLCSDFSHLCSKIEFRLCTLDWTEARDCIRVHHLNHNVVNLNVRKIVRMRRLVIIYVFHFMLIFLFLSQKESIIDGMVDIASLTIE